MSERKPILESAKIAVIVWLALIVAASIIGAIASFYTGRVDEVPKWNGPRYLLFSAKEFVGMGAVVTFPLALAAFVFAYLATVAKRRSPKE